MAFLHFLPNFCHFLKWNVLEHAESATELWKIIRNGKILAKNEENWFFVFHHPFFIEKRKMKNLRKTKFFVFRWNLIRWNDPNVIKQDMIEPNVPQCDIKKATWCLCQNSLPTIRLLRYILSYLLCWGGWNMTRFISNTKISKRLLKYEEKRIQIFNN